MKKTRQAILKLFTAMLLASVVFVSVPNISKAQFGFQDYQFGGLILVSFPCACSGTWLTTIGPPRPAILTYANTPQYEYYQFPRPGVWTVGLYIPYIGICYIPTPFGCVSIPNQGLVTPWVGTSL